MQRITAHLQLAEFPCFADTFVQGGCSVLRMKFGDHCVNLIISGHCKKTVTNHRLQ